MESTIDTPLAAYMRDGVFVVSWWLGFDPVTSFVMWIVFSRLQIAFRSSGRVILNWRTKGGKTVEVAMRVVIGPSESFRRLQRPYSFYFVRPSLVLKSQLC